jgi:phosphatidylglycerophosphate synthase
MAVPAVVFLLSNEHWMFAAQLLLIGVITDLIDGFLARLWSVSTTYGSVFDTQSDRILLAGAVFGILTTSNMYLWATLGLLVPIWLQDYVTLMTGKVWLKWYRPTCQIVVFVGVIQHLSPLLVGFIIVECVAVIFLLIKMKRERVNELATHIRDFVSTTRNGGGLIK